MAILKQGLEELNHGKVGRPFGFSNACFAAASLFRNATGIKYRQLQGLAEAIVGRVNAPGPDAGRHGLMRHLLLRLRCRIGLAIIMVTRQSHRGSYLGCDCLLAEVTAAQNRAGTSYRRPLNQPWAAA